MKKDIKVQLVLNLKEQGNLFSFAKEFLKLLHEKQLFVIHMVFTSEQKLYIDASYGINSDIFIYLDKSYAEENRNAISTINYALPQNCEIALSVEFKLKNDENNKKKDTLIPLLVFTISSEDSLKIEFIRKFKDCFVISSD